MTNQALLDGLIINFKRYHADMVYLSRVLFFSLLLLVAAASVEAEQIDYYGGEIKVYVKAGEPTVVSFPAEIEGGYRSSHSQIDLERRGKDLILFSKPGLSIDGEVLVIYVKGKQPYMLRVLPVSDN